jgi:hypothetical protein
VDLSRGDLCSKAVRDPLRTSSVHRSTSERAVPEGTTHNLGS